MEDAALYREFGRRIAARRSEMKLTQATLGNRVDMSRASIANIERGKQHLPLHQVYRLTEALDLAAVTDLLPPLLVTAAPAPSDVPIAEPEGGLSDVARLQVAAIFNDVDARR
ncbi:helix-turn-helix domain-containing protein [Sphingomonas sp. QA11]|uniref:helix-turn-helix transcriptional regulator n=1 Tax=Sphingomonas sp. QA11 TaxID=2950605 RepID=UPI002349DCB2|nr:helix-turn-helix transcriptional regulator [Sphingomonas sp. QA11]WCM26340.1 helix-turn-helix domain-containing protein [Sphingomonas sp. QA11]